jgi:uncharacterized protein YvpB
VIVVWCCSNSADSRWITSMPSSSDVTGEVLDVDLVGRPGPAGAAGEEPVEKGLAANDIAGGCVPFHAHVLLRFEPVRAPIGSMSKEMTKRQVAAAVLGLFALSACSATARAAPDAVAATPSLAPSPIPSPAPVTFGGTITRSPGALVRFGPGVDLPAMDVDPAGSAEVFDGWFADWFHLADGRGWVASDSVGASRPDGVAETAWTRPATLPGPTAGLLDIALHHQDQRATCEVAALQMALAGRGIAADERSLLAITGVDGRAPVTDAGGGIARWGDPNGSFVGDPNGNPVDHTGYGVYAAPIARAATGSGATVSAAGTGITPSAVYAAVIGGRPVVAWVTNSYRAEPLATWRAWDGAVVQYTLREHAVAVIGVTPTQVLLNDPWYGQRWHARGEFEAAYGTFGDMAVVLG